VKFYDFEEGCYVKAENLPNFNQWWHIIYIALRKSSVMESRK
jgi:hypothetical protein